MTSGPLISVVVPCYNYGEYLVETIDSVLYSTFIDLEIIVVDDGSNDPATIEVLQSIKDKPKTRIMHQSNKGVAAARNNGIAAANGKYILPLDAEDLIHPTFLEKACWIMEFYPEVGFVSSWVKAFGTEKWTNDSPQYNFYNQLFHNYICGTSLIRKEAFIQAGGYKSNFVVMGYEDWDFWISLGEKGWYGFQIFERLFFYRRHGRSMIHQAIEHHDELVNQIHARHPALYQPQNMEKLRRTWDDSPVLQMTPLLAKNSVWHSYPIKPMHHNRKRWLLIMPHIRRAQLQPASLNFIDGLHADHYAVTMVATEFLTGSNMEEFDWLTDDIFHLSLYVPKIELKLDMMERMISKLIVTRDIERVFLLGSRQGHYLRPYLAKGFPHIPFDIVD